MIDTAAETCRNCLGVDPASCMTHDPAPVQRMCRCNGHSPVPFVEDGLGHFAWCWDQLETTEGDDR